MVILNQVVLKIKRSITIIQAQFNGFLLLRFGIKY